MLQIILSNKISLLETWPILRSCFLVGFQTARFGDSMEGTYGLEEGKAPEDYFT